MTSTKLGRAAALAIALGGGPAAVQAQGYGPHGQPPGYWSGPPAYGPGYRVPGYPPGYPPARRPRAGDGAPAGGGRRSTSDLGRGDGGRDAYQRRLMEAWEKGSLYRPSPNQLWDEDYYRGEPYERPTYPARRSAEDGTHRGGAGGAGTRPRGPWPGPDGGADWRNDQPSRSWRAPGRPRYPTGDHFVETPDKAYMPPAASSRAGRPPYGAGAGTGTQGPAAYRGGGASAGKGESPAP